MGQPGFFTGKKNIKRTRCRSRKKGRRRLKIVQLGDACTKVNLMDFGGLLTKQGMEEVNLKFLQKHQKDWNGIKMLMDLEILYKINTRERLGNLFRGAN